MDLYKDRKETRSVYPGRIKDHGREDSVLKMYTIRETDLVETWWKNGYIED